MIARRSTKSRLSMQRVTSEFFRTNTRRRSRRGLRALNGMASAAALNTKQPPVLSPMGVFLAALMPLSSATSVRRRCGALRAASCSSAP